MTRFFLSQDNSCHWYIVPVDKRAEWDAWLEIPDDDERAWDAPEFAQRINCSPAWVTFENPKVEV